MDAGLDTSAGRAGQQLGSFRQPSWTIPLFPSQLRSRISQVDVPRQALQTQGGCSPRVPPFLLSPFLFIRPPGKQVSPHFTIGETEIGGEGTSQGHVVSPWAVQDLGAACDAVRQLGCEKPCG